MTARRLLLLVALAALTAGCASSKKAPYRAQKSGRDYYSVNKSSAAFIWDTFAQDMKFRKLKNKRMYEPGERRAENKAVAKASVAFLWDALKAGETDGWKYAWTERFPEMLKGPEDFGASVRFGFLDTGD